MPRPTCQEDMFDYRVKKIFTRLRKQCQDEGGEDVAHDPCPCWYFGEIREIHARSPILRACDGLRCSQSWQILHNARNVDSSV